MAASPLGIGWAVKVKAKVTGLTHTHRIGSAPCQTCVHDILVTVFNGIQVILIAKISCLIM